MLPILLGVWDLLHQSMSCTVIVSVASSHSADASRDIRKSDMAGGQTIYL